MPPNTERRTDMDGLVIAAIVLMVILVVSWIFYNRYVDRIIKDLQKEIEILERDNHNLINILAKKKENK